MANTIYLASNVNFVQTTLNGAINNSATTITLNSTTNIKAPGYVVIDRQNSAEVATPSAREVVSFTGISGNDLTGCTRGADGSTARTHNDGAIVEVNPTSGMWNSLATIVSGGLDGSGYLKAIASPVSIANLNVHSLIGMSNASVGNVFAKGLAISSTASIRKLNVETELNVSGASINGIPVVVAWEVKATISGATTILRTPLPIHRTGQWRYANFITRTVASGVSAIIDLNKNGTSIFAALGRPMIAAGGTFASTASIATKNFNQGDVFTLDYDGTGGTIRDIIAMLVSD